MNRDEIRQIAADVVGTDDLEDARVNMIMVTFDAAFAEGLLGE